MKNKWDIIGKDIDKESDLDYERWFGWWYDGDYNYDYGDYDPLREIQQYNYINTIYQDYVSKRGIRVTLDRMNMGSYIDMLSIYPKEIIRDIKISQILGVDVLSKPTFGDLLKNKDYDESRDI